MDREESVVSPTSPSRGSIRSDVGAGSLRSPIALPLPAVQPAPAYISQAAASELVTSQIRDRLERRQSQEEQEVVNPADAVFSESGVALINGFVDHILYQLLATARSTALSALRPAVERTLKPKLARQAFANADEELRDLLGEDDEEDEEEEGSVQSGDEQREPFDLDVVWRMTRLKVMVYTSTSDLDEEEEEHLAAEHMSASEHRQSRHFGLVSWTASIFLTSILEFVGEYCLTTAGQAAFDRSATRRRSKLPASEAQDSKVIVIDDFDVERIALNSSLGRLWRGWRKSLRSTRSLMLSSPASSRRPSIITNHSPHASRSGDESRLEGQDEGNKDTAQAAASDQDPDARIERNTKAFEDSQANRESLGPGVLSSSHIRSRSHGPLPIITSIQETEPTSNPSSRPSMVRTRSNSLPNPLRLNPPEVATEDVEPVPAIPDHLARNGKDEAEQSDSPVAENTVSKLSRAPRSRSVTPFEGESEYGADSERPDTAVSNYTNGSVDREYGSLDNEAELGPVRDAETANHTSNQTEDDSTGELATPVAVSSHATDHVPEESEDEMDAAETAAAYNSLPPNVAKREMPVQMVLPSAAVPGAFAPTSETRYEPHTPLQTVQEDQESFEEMTPNEHEGAANGARNVEEVSNVNEQSPSAPPSIYDDAPQERASAELPYEPATPTRDQRTMGSFLSESPEPNRVPAYTGTTVKILRNTGSEDQNTAATMKRVTPPSTPHVRNPSQSSSNDSRTPKARLSKSIPAASTEDSATMERNFEGLLAADSPKRYTLTPSNLRAIDSEAEPNTASQSAQLVARHKVEKNSSVSSVDGTHSSPTVAGPTQPPSKPLGPSWSVKYGRNSQGGGRPSKNGLQAREPRVNNESLREFADFIRSTAPDSRPGPGGHVVPVLVSENNSKSAQSATNTVASRSSRQSADNTGQSSPSLSNNSLRATKSNLSARDAATPRSNVNADLIDFLNQGPPANGISTTGLAASPRMNGRGGPRPQENMRTSSTTTQSAQDSVNSHSPLVNTNATSRAPPMNAPARKQHRVKDPYALPSDDEEDEEDDFPLPPQRRQPPHQQESLMDFLNNYDPPGSRQAPAPMSPKVQKMLGTNAMGQRGAPAILPHGSNDSSQVSLEASALPTFLRTEKNASTMPDSYTTTTIESLSSAQNKAKKGFWKKK